MKEKLSQIASRRTFLRGAFCFGAGLAVAALVGCGEEKVVEKKSIDQIISILETASDAQIVDFGKELRQIYEEGGIYVTADPTPETDDFRVPKGKFPGTMVVRNLEKYNGLKIEFDEDELNDPGFSAGDWAVRLAVDFDFARNLHNIVGEPTSKEIERILEVSTLTIGVQAIRSIDPSKLKHYSLFVPRQ